MKIKPFLTQEDLLTLFQSLILSHIKYCITIWCYGYSVHTLCYLISYCIIKGGFPNALKVSEVLPIYKGGDGDTASNQG